MPTVAQLGWMAAIIDLKGRLSYKKNALRRTNQITLSVDTKEWLVIQRLSQLTGTSPEVRDQTPLNEMFRRGCATHCPEAHVHVDREGIYMPRSARWTITGAGLVVVYHNLKDYLVTDRGYAQAVREIEESVQVTGRGSVTVLMACNRLKNLGWVLPEAYASALSDRMELNIAA
jgi:hypothetical protein